MDAGINSNGNYENKNDLEESKESVNNNKTNSEKEESEKEDEKEEENENSESDSNSKQKQKIENGNNNNSDEENENEGEEDEESNKEEEDEKSEKDETNSNKEKEIKNNLKSNILKSSKNYAEDNIIPPKYNKGNNKIDILEEYQNKFFINNLNNEQINSKVESDNLKALKEIGQDLTEISDNIEKIFLKLDTSSIHDEKFLIDSLIIEAKKEGILEETFGEKENEESNIKIEEAKLSKNNSKIIENEKNNSINNSKRINMSKIYENNNKENKRKFPYDYNKNRAYYEALNKKMNYNMNNINSINNVNYLKNSLQSQSDLFKSNEKDYFINNNQINSKKRGINNINIINNSNNFSFQNNNINITNNLLSSTDTTGPFRYTRKNMDEPDLMKLLMNK